MKKEKFKNFLKRFGVVAGSIVAIFAIVLAVALNVTPQDDGTEVSTGAMKFETPMQNAVVVKDYADDHLQYNADLKRWEIHLAVDLASDKSDVFAVCDGVVTSVVMDELDGCVVNIAHENGFESVYSSLQENTTLKVGDKVKAGQKIGNADKSAINESGTGAHLHFALLKNGIEVDPNAYLDLQNK